MRSRTLATSKMHRLTWIAARDLPRCAHPLVFSTILLLLSSLSHRRVFVWLWQGYALVEFENKDEAATAIKEMDGKELLGARLSVDWAILAGPKKKD